MGFLIPEILYFNYFVKYSISGDEINFSTFHFLIELKLKICSLINSIIVFYALKI